MYLYDYDPYVGRIQFHVLPASVITDSAQKMLCTNGIPKI